MVNCRSRRACPGVALQNGAICPTTTQAKSEYSLACIVLLEACIRVREITEGCRHASTMEQNLCRPPRVLQAEPFYTTVSTCKLRCSCLSFLAAGCLS